MAYDYSRFGGGRLDNSGNVNEDPLNASDSDRTPTGSNNVGAGRWTGLNTPTVPTNAFPQRQQPPVQPTSASSPNTPTAPPAWNDASGLAAYYANYNKQNSQGSTNPLNTPAPGGAPPKPYAPGQTGSNDPGVFTVPSYIQALNQNQIQQRANQDNSRAYTQYQNDYSNWQQNEAQRQALGLPSQPAPTAPSYEQFNQDAFNNIWNQGQNGPGGYNADAMAGLMTGSLTGGQNTGSTSAYNVGQTESQYPAFQAAQQQSQQGQNPLTQMSPQYRQGQSPFTQQFGSGSFPQMGQQQQPFDYASLFNGGPQSLYNSYGNPGQGNPFQFMSGQTSNPTQSYGSMLSGQPSMSSLAQILNVLSRLGGGNNFGGGGGGSGPQPWGQTGGVNFYPGMY